MPRTQVALWFRPSRITITSLLLIFLSALLATSSASPNTSQLEVFPPHFRLQPGERIHYQVLERPHKGSQAKIPCHVAVGFGCPEVKFSVENSNIVRLVNANGLYEAVSPGRTQLVFRTATLERRITVEVKGP